MHNVTRIVAAAASQQLKEQKQAQKQAQFRGSCNG
jgi:hypothetical protein